MKTYGLAFEKEKFSSNNLTQKGFLGHFDLACICLTH